MNEIVLRKVLGLLGLGARARSVVAGVDLVRSEVQRGRVSLVVMASDASKHSKAKLVPLLSSRGVAHIEGPTAAELGAAVGKGTMTAAVGVRDAALAKGIRAVVGNALNAV